MNTTPRHSIDPAYCPLLIQPEFPLSAAAGGFLPFTQYLDGVFLFQIDGEFIAMDVLGRTLAQVKSSSARLVQESMTEDGKAKIRICLQYGLSGDEYKTAVDIHDAPPDPPEIKPNGFSVFKQGIIFKSFGLKNPEGKVVIPAQYNGFSSFSEGFIIANPQGYSRYFDKTGRQLILFKRTSTNDISVYCEALDEASEFRSGIATVKTQEYGNNRYVIAPSGRCLGNRGWVEIRPICGGLIPVRSWGDDGWTLMNRAGDLLGSYYEQIFVTPTGAAFIPDDGGYRCIIPFGDDKAVPLRWQQMQEAEPGLLWAIRDGRHELIDCRENRLSPSNLYASYLKKTHSLSLHQEDDVVFLRAQNNAWFDVSVEDFFGYIDFLQQSCGLKYSFSVEHDKEDFHMLGFEGGRFHSPMKVIIDGTEKPCSLYIAYRLTQDGISFTPAMPAMRHPVVPAVDETGLRRKDFIDLDPDTVDRICRWQRHHDHKFCDYKHVNLYEYYPDEDEDGTRTLL